MLIEKIVDMLGHVLCFDTDFEVQLVFPGEFPSLNEIIKMSKSHPMAYANKKKQFTHLARDVGILSGVKVKRKAWFHFDWYSANLRKDPDNIAAGRKFILDGLVKAGVIKTDQRKVVRSLSDDFWLDRKNPRVEVTIRYRKPKGDDKCG